MCKATLVDENTKMVTIDGDYWSVTIINNKVRSRIGFIEPAQLKKAFKIYNAIIKV